MKGILGRKVGMTSVFATDGKLIPVTVIEVEPNVVMNIETEEKNGYNAITLGAVSKKEKASNKPEMGNASIAKTEPKRFLREIRAVDVSLYNVGDVLKADVFEVGEMVDATGTSKGKGFQGVIKRHNQHRGPMGHGSHHHRAPGSMGTMLPKRVLKGKKLPGHMGNEQVTIQNLEIISIDLENNCLLVKGNVPGPKNKLVLIRSSVKNGGSKTPVELVSYEEKAEEVTTEKPVEEKQEQEVVAEEVKPEETAEEVVEEQGEVEEKEDTKTDEEETKE